MSFHAGLYINLVQAAPRLRMSSVLYVCLSVKSVGKSEQASKVRQIFALIYSIYPQADEPVKLHNVFMRITKWGVCSSLQGIVFN